MEESRSPSGYVFPRVQAWAQRPFIWLGGRSKPPHREMQVSFDGGSGGSSRLGAGVQRAQHPVAAHLLHPLWMLGARPLLGASSDAFFPPRGHQPPRSTALGKSIPAGPASPRQESLISLQCCGRALCDGWVSCWGPGHLSPLASRLSPGPCDHPALHRHKPVVGPVSQTRLR